MKSLRDIGWHLFLHDTRPKVQRKLTQRQMESLHRAQRERMQATCAGDMARYQALTWAITRAFGREYIDVGCVVRDTA